MTQVIDKVCIIEDEEVHLFILKTYLEATQKINEVCVYDHGKVAFDDLQHRHQSGETLPTLIFLDLNMPVWDGWQFLDEFSQLDIENPPAIYIMTSSNSPYDLKKLNNYNMVTNYLVKPISRDAIATILESEVS